MSTFKTRNAQNKSTPSIFWFWNFWRASKKKIFSNFHFLSKMRRYLLNFATIISLTHAYPSGSYCARDGDTKIEIHVKSTTNLDARVGDAECKNVEYVFTSKDNFSISKQCLNLHDDLSYISSTNRWFSIGWAFCFLVFPNGSYQVHQIRRSGTDSSVLLNLLSIREL